MSRKDVYTTDGETTEFAITFPFDRPADISASVVLDDGTERQLLRDRHYVVDTEALTLTTHGAPLAAGTLLIQRDTPKVQPSGRAGWSATVFRARTESLTRMFQELLERSARTLQIGQNYPAYFRNTDVYGIAAPTLVSIDPEEVEVDDATFTLNLIGTNFEFGATVYADGDPLDTEFVSHTELNATVPDTLLTAEATIEIVVLNPVSLLTTNSLNLEVVEGSVSFTREVFTGTTLWTVPLGVTSIDILAVATGGPAAHSFDGVFYEYQGGGGGGGGVLVVLTCPVTPGEQLTITGASGLVSRASPLENLARAGDAGPGGENQFNTGDGQAGGANSTPLSGSTNAAGSRGGSGGGGSWSPGVQGAGGAGAGSAGNGAVSSDADGGTLENASGGGGGAGTNGTAGTDSTAGNGGDGIIPPDHSFGAWGTDIGESGYFGGGGAGFLHNTDGDFDFITEGTPGTNGLGNGAANTGGGGTHNSAGNVVPARTGIVAVVYENP